MKTLIFKDKNLTAVYNRRIERDNFDKDVFHHPKLIHQQIFNHFYFMQFGWGQCNVKQTGTQRFITMAFYLIAQKLYF